MQLQNSTIQPKKGHQTDKYQGTFHTLTKLRHGKGIYSFDNPFFTFEGNYQNGKKNGQGTLKFKDGRVINAMFINDQIIGKASIFFPNGSTYIGNLHLGEKDGQGTYSSQFQTYKGEWKNNCKHGKGIYQNHSNNQRYQGKYANDKPHGEGHLTRWNYQYRGDFENGFKNGQGHQISDWNKQQGGIGKYEYKGQFKQDLFSGTGQFKSRQSKYIYRGLFTNGLPNLYPNQFRCYLSVNARNGEQIVQGQKSILLAQPIEYQLQGDSFNLYIETVYQGPQALDQVQPTQQEIDTLIKNWQNDNKKNKNPPPMPDFNQPRMKKPEMIVVAQETGRPIELKLIKQVQGKDEYLKIDYRAQILAKRKENQQLRQQALRKAQEQGNKKGGKKDNKGQQELKVNLFKEHASAKQKILHIWTQQGKCSVAKMEFPDDFPQGKYYLQLRSTFKDFGQIKTFRKEINIKTKVVKKK